MEGTHCRHSPPWERRELRLIISTKDFVRIQGRIQGWITRKLQRMTPILPTTNPTLNCNINALKKTKSRPIFVRICMVGLEVGFNPTKKNIPTHLSPPSSMTLLQSCFSFAAAQQLLLCLHHCVPCLSCQLPPTFASAAAHLMIGVCCHCCWRPVAPLPVWCHNVVGFPSATSLQLTYLFTSSYRRCLSAAVHKLIFVCRQWWRRHCAVPPSGMDAGEDSYLQGCRTYKHAGGVILYPLFLNPT